MTTYSLSHLSDRMLLRDLATLVTQDRRTTAALLAHIAEVDERKAYLPAAYPSMFAYCLHELHLSEEATFKRIHAARSARKFPAIFEAVAEGKLHLSAVVMLAPHLTPDNADELLAAAAHKTRSEIELSLAQRFPRPDAPTRLRAIPLPPSPALAAEIRSLSAAGTHSEQHAPGRAEGQLVPGLAGSSSDQHAPGRVEEELDAGQVVLSAPERIEPPAPRSRVAPLAPQRFALQLTIGQGTRDKLRYAQALLGHQVPSGDIAEVLDRALDALIERLEKRKFAATVKPRQRRHPAAKGKRYIPADVKRAVWKRDGSQCTFMSETGQRCPARTRLEFDHMDEFARGGEATVGRMRLRCRAHNQHGAECTFGTEFMNKKRQHAQRAATEPRAKAAQRAAAEARAQVTDADVQVSIQDTRRRPGAPIHSITSDTTATSHNGIASAAWGSTT